MIKDPRRGARFAAAALALVIVSSSAPGFAQTGSECYDPNEPTPEKYGPTDISAVSGNQRLSVGLNSDATVTVFKWPSPSYYDQIKYRTTDRSRNRFGALPNEGAFLGIAWRRGPDGEDPPPWKFDWLRQWPSSQRFAGENGDEVVTVFRNREAGLKAVVRDVVPASHDALLRRVTVTRTRRSNARQIRIFSFVNFNPVFSKTTREPIDDWCTQEDDDDGASYVGRHDVILQQRSGTDVSTGNPSSVALTMGFAGSSDAHQVGQDTFETGAGGTSYSDSIDGKLSGSDMAAGQVDAALSDQRSLRDRRSASTTVILAAGLVRKKAIATTNELRDRNFGNVADNKRKWWKNWLDGARLPRGAPPTVDRLARRALISIRQTTGRRGLIMGSIATQSPYGLDWIRHGAYINAALDAAGFHQIVTKHNKMYAGLQAEAFDDGVPIGNWAPNFYGDGTAGGIFPHQIPYEIDETGLGIWTLWEHFRQTGNVRYLFDVYPKIRLAAAYLTEACRDPTTFLHCPANEEDDPVVRQTLVGAQAVWLGLDSAAKAASEIGPQEAANRAAWRARRNELGDAIDMTFFNSQCKCYTRNYEIGGALLWPVRFLDDRAARAESQAAVNWKHFRRVFDGEAKRGRLEPRSLLGNFHEWSNSAKRVRRIRRALAWIARVATTNETGLLGEEWMKYPPGKKARVTTMVSQPHVWNQAMFYLAALRAYGGKDYTFR